MLESPSFVSTSMWNKQGGQTEVNVRSLCQLLSILLFRQGLSLSLNPKLIIWLGWLANE